MQRRTPSKPTSSSRSSTPPELRKGHPAPRTSSKLVKFVLIPLLIAAAAGYMAYRTFRKPEYPAATATPTVSIVMIAHNENHYLERTFDSIMNNTPLEHVVEIIFVDDASEPPASTILDKMENPRIKIIRNDERQGLIRAKTLGANASQGDILVFLDAHVRTYPGWLEPMIRLTSENYKRVVVPMIPVLNGTTWEQVKDYVGVKLIFDWKMDFIWYVDNDDDYVPIMSGGLLAITRKWFDETGQYDLDMLQWGGENVEQSVKIWLCGGEIVVARDSRVGHVFRAESPYAINTTQIHVNKARAIDVWFDDWANYYYRANPFDTDRRSSQESLAPRFAIKERLGCKPFSTFVERFKNVMLRENLLPTEAYGIRDKKTGLCIALQSDGVLKGVQCDASDRSQVMIPESWNRIRSGKFTADCWAENETMRVALCSAHEDEQQHWTFEDGQVKRADKCLAMDAEGTLSMGACSASSRFEKFNPQPYSHELYH